MILTLFLCFRGNNTVYVGDIAVYYFRLLLYTMTIPDDNSFVNGGINNMSVRVRIATIRLLEKMEHDDVYSEKLGISDESRFHGGVVKEDSIYREEKL